MKVTASTLDAVVVTGTAGDVEKRTLGNSITQLDVADLTAKTTVTNITEVLQSKTPGLTLLPLTTSVAVHAARIRGQSGLAVPDAIVLATALQADATLLTNDRQLAGHAD